jgi:hypothetical protein
MTDIVIPVQGGEQAHTGRPHEAHQQHPGPWDHLAHTDRDERDQRVKHPPFSVPNGQSAPVFERAAFDWYASTEQIPATDATKMVDRQAGRKWMIISVLASAPAGIVIDSSAGSLFVAGAPNGFHVQKGGSISLPTEGPVWAVSDTPGTVTQADVVVGVNPQ